MVKPVLFGYIRAVSETPHAGALDVGRHRTDMVRFATREGFSLGQVFVESRELEPWIALESLLEATWYSTVTGILVPERTHLGFDVTSREATRKRIQTVAGMPVLTMHPGRDR